MTSTFRSSVFAAGLVISLYFFTQQHSRSEIESALKTYDRLIKNMDADSIALLYTTDGDLGTVAHGRDSIRKFLSSFKNVRVLSVASTSNTIEINRDTALQAGRYRQVALINNRDTAKLKGGFNARWIWIRGEGWRIKRMETQPDK